MISPFSRDTAFFQSLRDRNMTIAHGDLDDSFNELVEYLNKIISETIDILEGNKAVGIAGNSDSFLRNVGDGTTIFDIVRNSDVADSILTLDRFNKITPFSVLASDNNENLKSTLATEQNQSLVGDVTNLPKWQKLDFNNFADKSISSAKVGLAALSANHLAEDILGKPLNDNSIETLYIQDNTIPEEKVANNSITSDKISADLMNTRVTSPNLKFKEKCLSNRTINNNSVDFNKLVIHQSGQFINRIKDGMIGILTPACIPINAINLPSPTGYIDDQMRLKPYTQLDSSVIPSCVLDRSLNLSALQNMQTDFQGAQIIKRKNLSDEFLAILKTKGGLV